MHCTRACLWPLWQYGLWSFQAGGTKLEIFLPKNQHAQRKLLIFENLVKCQKLGIILENKVIDVIQKCQ